MQLPAYLLYVQSCVHQTLSCILPHPHISDKHDRLSPGKQATPGRLPKEVVTSAGWEGRFLEPGHQPGQLAQAIRWSQGASQGGRGTHLEGRRES